MELICCFCGQSMQLKRPEKYLQRPVSWQCRCGKQNAIACLTPGHNRGENQAPEPLPDKQAEHTPSVWRTPMGIAYLEWAGSDASPGVQRYDLRDGHNIVGRLDPEAAARADWPIETGDTCVSKRHIAVEKICRNGLYEYLLSDCGAKNEVFLNVEPDKRISERNAAATGRKANSIGKEEVLYLQSGDRIGLGAKTTIIFRIAKSDDVTPDPIFVGKRNTSN